MNTAQQEVLDKVIELLSEHFDHAVVAVGCYDEEKQYVTSATYAEASPPHSASASSMRPSGRRSTCGGRTKNISSPWKKGDLWKS